MREFKSSPMFTKDIDGRTVVGIAAVFGNIDDIADRIWPGAFTKTISEGRQRTRHLWNHDFSSPPIASIKRLEEVGRDALPQSVIEYAPEATGGLLVGRDYYKGVELSEWVFQAIEKADVDEMSFGFDAKHYEWSKQGEGAQEIRIRELREVMLYDTSDVLWGMNNATVANAKGVPLELIAKNLAELVIQIRQGKAGRRNAESDMKVLRTIHHATLDLGVDNCMGIKDPTEDGDKTRTAGSGAIDADSLSKHRQALRKLQLAALELAGQ